MNDLRKAAEMALEALEAHADFGIKADKAIEALRQALAQPEQEPVAWIRSGDDQLSLTKGKNGGYMVWKPLYTAPTSKPWASLTDDEIDTIYKHNHNEYGEDITGEYERELEAALKEKNT